MVPLCWMKQQPGGTQRKASGVQGAAMSPRSSTRCRRNLARMAPCSMLRLYCQRLLSFLRQESRSSEAIMRIRHGAVENLLETASDSSADASFCVPSAFHSDAGCGVPLECIMTRPPVRAGRSEAIIELTAWLDHEWQDRTRRAAAFPGLIIPFRVRESSRSNGSDANSRNTVAYVFEARR